MRQSTILFSIFTILLALLGSDMSSTLLRAQVPGLATGQTTAGQRAASTAFRVDTDIFLKVNNPKPDKQTLTLFKDGVYYDFPMDDEKQTVTMLDPLGGRIVVLSPSRQVKTVFKTAELLSHFENLQKDVSSNKALANMLKASEQSSFDEEKNLLRVGDDSFAYEATLQTTRDPSMAQQYADFADWSARLNTLLPPNFPPFVRFTLNREIAARSALPDTISRVTRHEGHSSTIRTKLIVNTRLSSDDEAKIRNVGGMLHSCKEVSQAEFYSGKPTMVGGAPGSSVRK